MSHVLIIRAGSIPCLSGFSYLQMRDSRSYVMTIRAGDSTSFQFQFREKEWKLPRVEQKLWFGMPQTAQNIPVHNFLKLCEPFNHLWTKVRSSRSFWTLCGWFQPRCSESGYIFRQYCLFTTANTKIWLVTENLVDPLRGLWCPKRNQRFSQKTWAVLGPKALITYFTGHPVLAEDGFECDWGNFSIFPGFP